MLAALACISGNSRSFEAPGAAEEHEQTDLILSSSWEVAWLPSGLQCSRATGTNTKEFLGVFVPVVKDVILHRAKGTTYSKSVSLPLSLASGVCFVARQTKFKTKLWINRRTV